MDVMVVVDMQAGLLDGTPKHDLNAVVDRINFLAAAIRSRAGKVVWIRHCGENGDIFEPGTSGWQFLSELQRDEPDHEIEKTLNDPFAGTNMQETLERLTPDRVLVSGWATDFCVDATVRSLVSRNFDVVIASDAHTVSDRPHLSALKVIQHHNWVWSGLLTNRSIRVAETAELLSELRFARQQPR